MEKTWEDFCRTGKVTDYLKYVNSEKEQRRDKEWEKDVTVGCVDRDGIDRNACR